MMYMILCKCYEVDDINGSYKKRKCKSSKTTTYRMRKNWCKNFHILYTSQVVTQSLDSAVQSLWWRDQGGRHSTDVSRQHVSHKRRWRGAAKLLMINAKNFSV